MLENTNVIRESTIEQQTYFPKDIQEMLGISKSRVYTFLAETYALKDPPFRVIRVGKLFRVPKKSFDQWLNGCA